MRKLSTLLLVVSFMLIGCNAKLALKQVSIPQHASLIKVDSNQRLQMSIYSVTVTKALGKMDISFVIGKDSLLPKTGFRIIADKHGVRISNDFVALTTAFGKKNWGWFHQENGQANGDLPNIRHMIDSLKSKYGKDYFITHTNGIINVLRKGKKIDVFDYGDLQYDSAFSRNACLSPGLYSIIDNQFILISSDPDDLFKQQNGVFYVPPPGYGIIKKVNKERLYAVIDSAYRLKPIPYSVSVQAE